MFSADQMPNGQLGAHPSGLPSWAVGPFRLVSLLDMLQFHASEFIAVTNAMSMVETRWASFLRTHDGHVPMSLGDEPNCEPEHKLLVEATHQTLDDLSGLLEYLKRLGLDCAISQVERIQNAVESGREVSEVIAMLSDLRLRIEDQLQNRLFLFIPTNKAWYITTRGLFGEDVETKMPEAHYDIVEAGKCLEAAKKLKLETQHVWHEICASQLGILVLSPENCHGGRLHAGEVL